MKIFSKASAGLASWIGRSFGLTDRAFWRHYFGGDNYSGKTVTAQTALQLSAVWACVRQLSSVVSTLPLFLYEKDPRGVRTLAARHPLYAVLHVQPNADMTAAEFWECMVASLCLWGNAYALIHRNGAGDIAALDPMRPENMRITRDKVTGDLTYAYVDSSGKRLEYSERDVFHVKGFSLDGLIGLSPIAYARNTLGAAMAQEETSGKIFANGLRPSGVVSTDQILNKGQRAEIRESVISQVANSEQAGRTVVLEAGMKYQPVAMNPEDAQLLQSRAFSIEEICRWFYNMPPILIGHAAQGQTMWGSGVEQVMMGWRVMGLGPLLVKIEQAIRRQLLTPSERRTHYAKYNVEGLLRADAAGRAQLYSSRTQNGSLNRNEVRAYEDEPPYEGGDVFTVQSNLIPVSQLGKTDAGSSAAKDAFRSWLNLPSIGEQEK